MNVWITVVHNFVMNPNRQSVHVFETQEEAQKIADGWNSKRVKAFVAEVSIVELLNILAGAGEFYHLEWSLKLNQPK